MPREFQQDGDLQFQGFQTFTNSAAFDPNKGIVEYLENMRIDEGVLRPRKGMRYVGSTGVNCNFATSGGDGSANKWDYIYLWGSDNVVRKMNSVNGQVTVVSGNVRTILPVGGTGYRAPAAIEAAQANYWSGSYDFTCAEHIIGRTVYAKYDQVWFSLYGGIQPFDPDTVSLCQNTRDYINALHYSETTRKLMAFGPRSMYAIEPNISTISALDGKVNETNFHKVQLLSAHEGCIAPDSVDECGGKIFFVGLNGLFALPIDFKWIEGQGPESLRINNYFEGNTKLSTASGAAANGRYYLSFSYGNSDTNNTVLVINPLLPNLFESIDTYNVQFKHMVVARNYDGKPKVCGVTYDGKVYMLDENDFDSSDALDSNQNIYPATRTKVVSTVRTRNYMFKTHMDKRYDAVTVYLENSLNASIDINFITINPDSSTNIDTSTNIASSSVVRRALAAKKSMGAKVELKIKSGFPSIYSIMVDASVPGRSIFSVL